MTRPAKRQNARESALPAPELVSLGDEPQGRENVIQAPWWVAYGGWRDEETGVLRFPRCAPPPECPFPCQLCDRRDDGSDA